MNMHSSRARSVIGFSALAVTWITAAVTVPLIATLKGHFSPEELLFVRSLFGVAAALILVRGAVWKTDRRMVAAGILVGLSSIAFYRAVQAWGVDPCMVVMSGLPAINVAFAIWRNRRISGVVVSSLICVTIGIVVALEPWKQPISWPGLWYMIGCNVVGGLGFELWGQAPASVSASQKCFWMAVPLLVLCPLSFWATGKHIDVAGYFDPHQVRVLAFFGFACGILYIYATIVPFGKIETQMVSVLLQGTTPASIIGAYFLAGESLSAFQWSGVAVALAGTIGLSLWLAAQTVVCDPDTSPL